VLPIALASNRPARFYRGGARIDAFRGERDAGPDRPEDWVGSATTLYGQPRDGLTTIGGRTLREMIEEDPIGWLGREHIDRLGPEPGILVKLLAPDQRLPVHAHPDRTFARRWLSSRWGKTEAWVVLEPGPSGTVWLGWREPFAEGELRDMVAAQAVERLLAHMHEVSIDAGDGILVPAGTAHAIGAGVLLLELQEPTDFSILLEWQGYDVGEPRGRDLGLGLDVALGAVVERTTSPDELAGLILRAGDRGQSRDLLPSAAAPFFRAEQVAERDGEEPAGFGVLVVVSGEGQLECTAAAPMAVRSGMTLVMPAGAGPWHLTGDVAAIWCHAGAGP
jgi:mannose-6-phosphate isomerase